MPRHAAEWDPEAVPACVRCGERHLREWIVRADDGWVGERCLAEAERAAWCQPEEVGKGKVHIPVGAT